MFNFRTSDTWAGRSMSIFYFGQGVHISVCWRIDSLATYVGPRSRRAALQLPTVNNIIHGSAHWSSVPDGHYDNTSQWKGMGSINLQLSSLIAGAYWIILSTLDLNCEKSKKITNNPKKALKRVYDRISWIIQPQTPTINPRPRPIWGSGVFKTPLIDRNIPLIMVPCFLVRIDKRAEKKPLTMSKVIPKIIDSLLLLSF